MMYFFGREEDDRSSLRRISTSDFSDLGQAPGKGGASYRELATVAGDPEVAVTKESRAS